MISVRRNIKLFGYFQFFSHFLPTSPILIIYVSLVLKSYTLALSLLTIQLISSSILEIPTGILSDKIGRKQTCVLGGIFGVLEYIAFTIGGIYESYFIFSLGALFGGICLSFFSGNNHALLFESLKELKKKNHYHTVLGKTSSMLQLALGISAILGGAVAEKSFLMVFVISTIARFITLIITLFFVEPKKIQKSQNTSFSHFIKAVKTLIQNKKLVNISIGDTINYTTGYISHMLQPVFFQSLISLSFIGILRGLKHATGFFSFWFAGKIINKFGNIKTLIFGTTFNKINNLVSLIMNNTISPILMSCGNLFFGTTQIAKENIYQHSFSDQERATTGSVVSFLKNLSYGICTLLTGILADIVGVRTTLIIITSIAFTGIYFFHKAKD